MKKIILTLLIIFTNILAFGQTENITFQINDTLKQEGKFNKNEQKVGKWKYYHDDGELKYVGKYKQGKLNGKWIGYYDNGKSKFLQK